MLSSVLLHLSGAYVEDPAVDRGVDLARRKAARVRGLTLVDTRRLARLCTSETAALAAGEVDRLDRLEQEQGCLRLQLSRACLSAGVPFDVRQVRGNPFELLPHEARLHDLVVTACPAAGKAATAEPGFTPRELINLLMQGVHPLLIVRDAQRELRRVLLVGDGSSVSWRALRQYLGQELLPQAEHRLLALGPTESTARTTLAEMTAYCRHRLKRFEAGWGQTGWSSPLIPFARKWEADLVVLGVEAAGFWRRSLGRLPAEQLLRCTDLALYAVG